MIYFHIPFCKQACHYCDFHFSTSLQYKADMLEALMGEMALRADYLEDKTVHSIYFGGGTPSILDADDIKALLDRVADFFSIAEDAEITLEANPDDLTVSKVNALRQTAINRFSIGIQSFHQEDLQWMNRAHNSEEAASSIKRVQDAGFPNITCDLIYGYPLLSDEKWTYNIKRLLDFKVPHISAYSMTVENKTALAHFIKSGKTAAIDDDQAARQMSQLIETLTANGFDHYEISNFARKGYIAQHNTNYWKGKPYLGIGPSAHSFNGSSRSWNVANNPKYMAGINAGKPAFEEEQLSRQEQENEYIMTALRTMWGIDIAYFKSRFGERAWLRLTDDAEVFVKRGQLKSQENHLILSDTGKLLADHIMSALFIV